MNQIKNPYLKGCQTFQCITKFQLIPPNIVNKENPVFSAFSKTKLRKSNPNENQQTRKNKSEFLIKDIQLEEIPSKKSFLLGRGQSNKNLLEGVLRARKSQMRKHKLKEFYLEQYDEKENQEAETICHDISNAIEPMNSIQFNTIQSKQSSNTQHNLPLFQKKRILPVKLRAKSYSNISRSLKDRTLDKVDDQNSLSVRPQTKMSLNLKERKNPKQKQSSKQNYFQINSRRTLRSQKRNKHHKLQNQRSILGEIQLKINESLDNMLCQKKENENNCQSLKYRKEIKRNYYPQKFNESRISINGWDSLNHQDDRKSQFFI